MQVWRRPCFHASALLLASLWSSAAAAMPIAVVAQTRSVSVETTHPSGSPDTDFAGAADSSPFDALVSVESGTGYPNNSMASAKQTSLIGDDRIQMTGRVDAWTDAFGRGTALATLVFDVTFDLLGDSDYYASNHVSIGEYYAQSSNAYLYDDEGNVVLEMGENFGESGFLDAGRYRLELITTARQASWRDLGWATHQFNLYFTTPVPEPSTGLLTAFGLVGIAARRSRPRIAAR